MVDVADAFHRGEMSAGDVLKKFNRDVIGKRGRSGYLKPIRVARFFCYNFRSHENNRIISSEQPGKCPECGQELEDGKSRVPL